MHSPVLPTLRQAEALVGLPFVDGEFDCVHLAVRAQAELFGRTVLWPAGTRHPRGRRGQIAEIERSRDQVVDAVEVPESGDIVLMRQRLHDETFQYHVGTLIIHAGQRWVLHVFEGHHSVLQPEADMYMDGTRRDGYYRWREAE